MDEKKFDEWASSYDDDIKKRKGYPFEGYFDVHDYIHDLVEICNGHTRILDVGVGTGELLKPLYDKGAIICGFDFSRKMIDIARTKMPRGNFEIFNFKFGVPKRFTVMKFDYILSSYALHHISNKEKIHLVSLLIRLLAPNGKIIIADVAFQNEQDFKDCRGKYLGLWDNDEVYLVADEFINTLKNHEAIVNYQQISECAGVFIIEKTGAKRTGC